jgi:hypothetical protein
MSILKPKDGTYQLPAVADPSDVFRYIAEFNGFQYFDTDPTGVTHNEIAHNWFFINRADVGTPEAGGARMRFDGVLFVGQPSDIGTETSASTSNAGQFVDIVKPLLNLQFANALRFYAACDVEININNLRPLYNSVKYTKAGSCTGVEVAYTILM